MTTPTEARIGGKCHNDSCNGTVIEVEITEEHKRRSSHNIDGQLLVGVAECDECEATYYEHD